MGAQLNIDNSVFEDNETNQQGGAIQVNSGILDIRNSLFRYNHDMHAALNSHGGAISTADSVFRFESSAAVANVGDTGGGVAVTGGSAVILNSTFSGNRCAQSGCGLALTSQTDATLRFNTIAGNQTDTAEAVMGANAPGLYASASRLTAYGNLIARNIGASHDLPDCVIESTPTVTAGHNFIGKGGGTCQQLGAPDNVLIGTPQQAKDPILADLPIDPPVTGVCTIGNVGASCKGHSDCVQGFGGGTCSVFTCDPGAEGSTACIMQLCDQVPVGECSQNLGIGSGAIAAFGSGASNVALASACPLTDQRVLARPTATSCSLGAVEPVPTMMRFNNLPGSATSSVPSDGTADFSQLLPTLEAPQNVGDNYGLRIAGLLVAPTSGSYTFFIAGDDNVTLYLSTDSSSAHKTRIAYHTSYTGFREWTKFATQRSAAVTLTAGVSYYIEAVLKESSGSDNVSVGWLKPGQSGSVPSAIVPLAFSAPFVPRGDGSIELAKWLNIGGSGVSTIPLSTTPSSVESRTLFEAQANMGDNYGIRMRGWLTAPTTGAYRFWVAGDDSAALYLAQSGGPENKSQIAYNNAYTGQYEWNKYSTQQSQDVQLVAGQRYYIEALLKESSGSDHLEVGWRLPGQSGNVPSEVIPGRQLSPFTNPVASAIVTGQAEVRNVNSNLCMDVWHAQETDGTRIDQFTCNTTPAQQFDLTSLGSGLVRIAHHQSQKCAHATGTADGSNVELKTCQSSNLDRWQLYTTGTGGTYTLRNAASGRCLDVEGNNLASESNLELRDCSSAASQRFRLSATSGSQLTTLEAKGGTPISFADNTQDDDMKPLASGVASANDPAPSCALGVGKSPGGATTALLLSLGSLLTLRGRRRHVGRRRAGRAISG